jgi:hypothetical protein
MIIDVKNSPKNFGFQCYSRDATIKILPLQQKHAFGTI